jgi:hypothetical protein
MSEKWNVPGTSDYDNTTPLDPVLRSDEDQQLRGYWLGRAGDGQICFISNNNNNFFVTVVL